MINQLTKKIKLESESEFYNSIFKNNNYNEILFWKIWKFSLLRNKIISFLSISKYKYKVYKYEEIYKIEWMIKNNYIDLLKLKVRNKEFLVFSGQLYFEYQEQQKQSKKDKEYGILKKKKVIFNTVQYDEQFYKNLFKNYKEIFLNNFSFTFNLLAKYDCLVGFKVLKEIYENRKHQSIHQPQIQQQHQPKKQQQKKQNNYIGNDEFKLEYSKLIIECINCSSFKIGKFLIENYKFNISCNEIWKTTLKDSTNLSMIKKIEFIKENLSMNPQITKMNLQQFSIMFKFYKIKLKELIDCCFVIESIKEQLNEVYKKIDYPYYLIKCEEQFKGFILSKDQLNEIKNQFTIEEFDIKVYKFSSCNLNIKMLLEMVALFSTVCTKNIQFLYLKYYVNSNQLVQPNLLKYFTPSHNQLAKFGILTNEKFSIGTLKLFKYIKNDKEKKLNFLKIYFNRFSHQNYPLSNQVDYLNDIDCFDILKNYFNFSVSLQKMMESCKNQSVLKHYKTIYCQDYNIKLKEFLDQELLESKFKNQSLSFESLEFILNNSNDFEILLSNINILRNYLYNKFKTIHLPFNIFKLLINKTTKDFKINLKQLYFKEMYYDTLFWLMETNQLDRLDTNYDIQKSDSLLNYYLKEKIFLPEDKFNISNQFLEIVGSTIGEYNFTILNEIIKKHYIICNNNNNNQTSIILINDFNDPLVKILEIGSKVGNLLLFKKLLHKNGYFGYKFKFNDNILLNFIAIIFECGHSELLDFLFSLGYRKLHISVEQTKYNENTSLLFLDSYSKKSIFK